MPATPPKSMPSTPPPGQALPQATSDSAGESALRRSPRIASRLPPPQTLPPVEVTSPSPADPAGGDTLRRSPRIASRLPLPQTPPPVEAAAPSPEKSAGGDALRRSPRIANRIMNPRVLMQQWLQEDREKLWTPPPSLPAENAAAAPATAPSDSDDDFEEKPMRVPSKKRRARYVHLFNESDRSGDESADASDRSDEDDMDYEDEKVSVEDVSSSSRVCSGSSISSRYSTVPVVEVLDDLVRVPDLRILHDSWDAFSAYLDEYARETTQAIRTKNTVSCVVRNAEIDNTQAAKQGKWVRHVDESWGTYKRTYICTHGWKIRDRKMERQTKQSKQSKKSKKGKQPAPQPQERNMRWLRATNCPFKFVVQMVWCDDKEWKLAVCNPCMLHNHRVGHQEFKTLAENRGIKDPTNMAKAQAMIEHGCKPREVFDEMLSRGENVILRDAENMQQAFKREIKREDDDSACLGLLEIFVEEAPGNFATLDETVHKETGVISMTSEHMGEMMSRFGEMLLVDCTHKTNRYNYQLLTLMVINDYGEGQVIQHSLIERNADWHMSRALDHFVRANPHASEKVQVIMVDKDLNEIKVLRMYFPSARILICIFHVIKYLSQMIRKPDFGKISSDDRDNLEAVVHSMVYAKSKAVYDDNYATLRDICGAIGYTKFLEYFDENWHTCTDMWVVYTRARLPHFRVHTNNHLESFFGHVKGAITPKMDMTETMTALIKDDRARENAYTHRRSRVGGYHNKNYDEAMNELLKFTNPFIAQSVEEEYQLALAKTDVFSFDHSSKPGKVVVTGHTKTHDVDTRSWKCTCSFSETMQLPCQHAIAARKVKDMEVQIPLKAVGSRWLGPAEDRTTGNAQRLQHNVFDKNAKKRKLTSRDKYREATRATEALRSELADIADDDEFYSYLNFVLDQWRSVRQRRLDPGNKNEPVGDMEDTDADDGGEGAKELDSTEDETKANLSQAHSLYSEELGRVSIVAPVAVPLAGDLVVPSQEVQATRSSESDSDFEKPDEQPTPRVVLNPRAAKSGRPRLNKKAEKADDRENRLRFNAAKDTWKKAGDPTLPGLVEELDLEQPGLIETAERLDGLRVRNEDSTKAKSVKSAKFAKPKYTIEKAPVLNTTAFYLLPFALLDRCFEVLPLSNKKAEAIAVFSQSSESSQSQSQSTDAATGHQMDTKGKREGIECVTVAHYGKYSRAQIEAMRYLMKLKDDCEEGKALSKWLREEVSDFRFDGRPAKIAAELESKYPYSKMPGFAQDYTFEELYRIRPHRWVSDALISAFCERICNDFKQVRYIEVVTSQPKQGRAKKVPLPQSTTRKLTAAALDDSSNVMIVPVNFSNSHWTVVIVFKDRNEILYYDSIGEPAILNRLGDIAQDIGTALYDVVGKGFNKTSVNNPIQYDGFSCGIFVCHKIARLLDRSVSNDMSDTGLTNFRFRLLAYVLQGVEV